MDKGHNLRGSVFWLLDFFKGGKIKSALKKTSLVLEGNKNSQEENKISLNLLLKHATETTKYYSDFLMFKGLNDFPVINKNIIRDNLESISSSKYNISDCKKVSTSGSTGTPFSVYQNKEKQIKNIADNIYFSFQSNYRVGDYISHIKIWPERFNIKSKIYFKAKNMHPWSVFKLSDSDIDDFIKSLNNSNDEIALIGYASAFYKICKYLDTKKANPIEFKTKSVIAISESLKDYTRESIKKYFGVQPFSRYSNNENGIIAQQINLCDKKFKINHSSYVVEILDLNSNKKLRYGEKGRIVLTDLYNYATPLIRYDTGDVGVVEVDESNVEYFTEISGRKLDLLYDTQGNLIPSHLSSKLVKYGNFRQFQLVQKSNIEYQINLNTDEKVDEVALKKEFRDYFGKNAIIEINYFNDIPLLSSGKVREVINEYYS